MKDPSPRRSAFPSSIDLMHSTSEHTINPQGNEIRLSHTFAKKKGHELLGHELTHVVQQRTPRRGVISPLEVMQASDRAAGSE